MKTQIPIKFRQFIDGKYHYWGFLEDGVFIGPAKDTLSGDKWAKSQQFTGRKDKNKREIYVGDVVEITITWGEFENRESIKIFDVDFNGLEITPLAEFEREAQKACGENIYEVIACMK